MAIVSIEYNYNVHISFAYTMFSCISLYCFLHTIIIVYLYIQRDDAPQHTNVFYPIWFVICSLFLIAFFAVWLITNEGMPEYIAAASPFLYLLGFVPQFWFRAKTRKRDSIVLETMTFSNDLDA